MADSFLTQTVSLAKLINQFSRTKKLLFVGHIGPFLKQMFEDNLSGEKILDVTSDLKSTLKEYPDNSVELILVRVLEHLDLLEDQELRDLIERKVVTIFAITPAMERTLDLIRSEILLMKDINDFTGNFIRKNFEIFNESFDRIDLNEFDRHKWYVTESTLRTMMVTGIQYFDTIFLEGFPHYRTVHYVSEFRRISKYQPKQFRKDLSTTNIRYLDSKIYEIWYDILDSGKSYQVEFYDVNSLYLLKENSDVVFGSKNHTECSVLFKDSRVVMDKEIMRIYLEREKLFDVEDIECKDFQIKMTCKIRRL